MFSTIVVGTDGSQTARRAVAVAAELARQSGARLHLVHGYRDPGADELASTSTSTSTSTGAGTGAAGASPSPFREASEAVLAEALDDAVLDGVAVAGHSEAGPVPEVIVAVARRTGADLIVVGNRGLRTAATAADSVPSQVAHRAPCHVLIAKTT